MPPQTTIDDPRHLRQEIELLVERLSTNPVDLALHEQLRETALRHKAAGGRDVGTLERLRPAPKDPLRRLLHVERLWSFDPGNTERLGWVAQALEAYASEKADLDVEPVRQPVVPGHAAKGIARRRSGPRRRYTSFAAERRALRRPRPLNGTTLSGTHG